MQTTRELLLSEAAARLEKGMFGGLKRPLPVQEMKARDASTSVGFAAQKQQAAQEIASALEAGHLTAYVQSTMRSGVLLKVSTLVISKLVRSRGAIPDRVVRLPHSLLRSGIVTPDLFAALSASPLMLREADFDDWYERQWARGLWPSQRRRSKPHVGRRSKKTGRLRDAILGLVHEGKWKAAVVHEGKLKAADSIEALRRHLAERGIDVKKDTVRRTVGDLHLETGDRRLCVQTRMRKSRS